jgi:hypothetical protein
MPFGPEVSWPNGFRQLDSESRRVLESGYGPASHGPASYGGEGHGPASYGSGSYGSASQGGEGYGAEGYGSAGYAAPGSERGAYDHVGPGYGGAPAYGHGPGYRQPAMDDYGYGDPGYSDPSYEGPRSGSGGSTLPGGNRGSRAPGGPAPDDGSGYGRLPGYQVPEYRESSHRDFGYPAPPTGAAQIYPITGAQEALPATGPQPVADRWAAADPGYGSTGSQAYPEQWYDHPRLNDQRRPDPPAASDPRLEGMRYDELRYEEPAFGRSGFDEPLDADSWVEELRRSAPVYPQRPGGPSGGTSGPDQRSADPQRRADPRVSGYGQQPGYPQAPAPDQSSGYGQGRDDRGGQAPRMSAARDARPSVPAAPSDPAPSDPGYLGAPASRVVVLTPPAIRRLEVPAEDRPLPGAAATGQLVGPAVRPGHGLDGPEITSSWPAQPQVDDLDDFEDFWREDDDDDAYPGLFPDEAGARDSRTGARAVGRGIGRRRGRSRDHRLWLALIGVVVVAAGAIFGILKFEFPSHGGPAHTMDIPNKIGSYVRTVDLEKQTHLAELRDEVIQMSAGQASGVVSGVYEAGDSAAGSTTQIIMVIEGHLANAAPATSIAAFTTKFPGATVVPAGALGGQAACVENGAGTSNPVSMCVWFDNDSFGEIVSPTMNAAQLATAMQTVRPAVELVAKK